eukprot:augustus_masked-scaffold_32-processed-gene-1.7-mRNA-1 protein AED:1.00 eAED:1.00 QI:0/-1/0/0/-1/1/1/0/324
MYPIGKISKMAEETRTQNESGISVEVIPPVNTKEESVLPEITNLSVEDEKKLSDTTEPIIESVSGLRVMEIQKNSPLKDLVVLFIDIIVEVNHVPLGTEVSNQILINETKSKKDQELEMKIFNLKNKQYRYINCTPNSNWGGKGLLGITISLVDINIADFHSNVLHVMNVKNNSPADKAFLKSDHDFIIGTRYWPFVGLPKFAETLKDCALITLEVFVFNTETDEVRNVRLRPKYEWYEIIEYEDETKPPEPKRGEGVLGCSLGQGLLHRIPEKSCLTIGKTDKESFIVAKERFIPKPKPRKEEEVENVPGMEAAPAQIEPPSK